MDIVKTGILWQKYVLITVTMLQDSFRVLHLTVVLCILVYKHVFFFYIWALPV